MMFGFLMLALGGGGATQYDIYADSINGSDANDGTTLETALQTLSAVSTQVQSLGAGTKVALATESMFASELNIDSLSNVRVEGLEEGVPALIDGSDPASTWTQPDAGGAANVWSQQWISTLNASTYSIQVWEDDRVMTPVASRALCNSTPGSSFIPTVPDGDDQIEVHATGSGDPNSNGRTYRITRRRSCVRTRTDTATNLTVRGVHTRRPGWLSGSIVAFTGLTAERCLLEDGVDHGMLFASGNVNDCIFIGSSPLRNAGTSNMLVVFTSTAGTYEARVRRTGFLAGANPDAGTYENVAGIFSHNDQVGVTNAVLRAEACWFVDLATAGEFRGATVEYVGNFLLRCGPLTVSATNPCIFDQHMHKSGNAAGGGYIGNHTYRDCTHWQATPWRSGAFTLQNVTAVKTDSTGLMQPTAPGINNITINRSILIVETWGYAIDLNANTGYTGDYNILAGYFTGRQVRTRIGGVERQTLAAWQSATGQDANSVYVLPADQVAAGANALWLAYAQAAGGTDLTTIGPQVGDFRINPNARVYSGANVAYIGTFPDGTAITTVGAQNHWDWSARQSVSGPPAGFPDVPENLADSVTYITDPTAWDFYP